jgi:hypothetical protein
MPLSAVTTHNPKKGGPVGLLAKKRGASPLARTKDWACHSGGRPACYVNQQPFAMYQTTKAVSFTRAAARAWRGT